MRQVFRYLFIVIFIHTLSLSALIRHIYEFDGAQAIQDSIDISGLFDTVMVHNGKYFIGDISDPSGIQLRGRRLMSTSPDSAPCCTLSALSTAGLDTTRYVIWDTLGPIGWYSLIQGFTITEGKYCGIYISNWYIYSGFTLTIQDNIITKNRRGILAEFSSGPVTIQRNRIINNGGVGIVSRGSSPAIKNNIIKVNINYNEGSYLDGYGGGILVESGLAASFLKNLNLKKERDPTVIEDNLIVDNYAEKYGGGICFGYRESGQLSGNTVAFNEAGLQGGGIRCEDDWSNISGDNNIFIANRANIGGGISTWANSLILTRTFAVDNGSYDTSSGLLNHIGWFCDMNHSNIYYNTYQKDIEIFVDSLYVDSTSLKNNFWWITDSAGIDSLIDGPADFIPFEMGFVPDAPGEPVEIYSVLNYSPDYFSIIDSIGRDPDTLYLEITGHDRNPEYQEAAVAILKTNIYPTGIAVALLETDTASGIYRGEAIVKTTNPPDSIRMDDIYQIIRVSPDADTIRVYANMDTTEIFKVYYRCHSGIKEDMECNLLIEPLQNPVFSAPEFRFFLPEKTKVELNIYDPSGRLINNVLSKRLPSGWHSVKGKIEKSGIYFYRLKTQIQEKTGKIIVIK